MSERLTHWLSRVDGNAVHWFELDKANSSANALSQEVLAELELLLARAQTQQARGIVISSAKTSGFIVGADITEFSHLANAEQGAQLAARGQQLFAKIANLPIPSVAAIDGFALGGGLELALACHYRVAVESHEPTLGLPEVQLGIHPGFGGTVRSVELLGAPAALDMMLTGRSISPVKALAIGLVDRIVEKEMLAQAAAEFVARRPSRRRAPWYLRVLANWPLRTWLASNIRAKVAKRARPEHYPAPYAIVKLWERYGAQGMRAYEAEARSIGELLVGSTCRSLVRIFFLRERLRNLAPRQEPIKRVHVVGAGVMGGDIASWCAMRGLTVTLQDTEQKFVNAAITRAEHLFARRIKYAPERAAALTRLLSDVDANEIGSAEIVIEAIAEKIEAKQGLYRQLEPKLTAGTILATNTSSIKLEDMASELKHPELFVGLHFFNPVASLPLVEVIKGEGTADSSVQRALAFVTQIGKLPLPCRSAPGFLVNRILAPYMLEALRAHEEGYQLEAIDAAAEAFGMPVGPVELADRVGLDVASHVAAILHGVIDGATPDILRRKVEAKELGVKTGRGFYRYEHDRAVKTKPEHAGANSDLQDRLILLLINEAVACYEDGVVDDYDLLDAGVVFGTGFAPFRGGPIYYARQRGVAAVVDRLRELARSLGPRFEPHPGWEKLRA
jgi:3-hydroxyacyl-CoA dehydrogenase / enoyl-CoA hydratase / 3-hydroxybutyryl-CoA epimerase